MRVFIPYGKNGMEIDVPDSNLAGVLESKELIPSKNHTQQDIVNAALDSPIGTRPLDKLSAGKSKITVITSDHTRPLPSRVTLPPLLARIRRGNPDADITILVATGFHRATTKQELLDKFGREIVENEKLVIHDSRDTENQIRLDDLPSGGELWVNRLAIECDLLVSEGFIEPHFFAGFSGGRKSVLPGVAGYRTVLANHCAAFISSAAARAGMLDQNPINVDMEFAAKTAKLAFISNVILDHDKKVVRAFAGHFREAHRAGCECMIEAAGVEPVSSDVVVTSNGGYPLDQNVYQAVKGMSTATLACREGGVIIMVSACADGHGGESFYRHLAEMKSPRELLAEIEKTPRNATEPDQWEYQILARILSKHHVIMVTDQCDPEMITNMGMEHANNFPDALKRALEISGCNSKIAVIPDGVGVFFRS